MITAESQENWNAMAALHKRWGYCLNHEGWLTIWIGVMLRRYDEAHPGGLRRWRVPQNLTKIVEWQVRAGEPKPDHLDVAVERFIWGGDRGHLSGNPWSVTRQTAWKFNHPVVEYSIGKVPTLDDDFALAHRQKQEEEEREAACRRTLPLDDLSDLD
ncbi:MAG: hypothetical protein M3O31_04890 [Acidobacteriota bacterium]|nr:hypothetical protein [Acidobacteriota bacterium]